MRLIDADALIESLSKNCPENTMTQAIVEIFKACVDSEPIIETEPQTGKWSEKKVLHKSEAETVQPKQAVKDCRNCKHGAYNDHWETHFCYNPNECTEWELWEPIAQPEIIRCKDCVLTDGYEPIADGRYWCMLHGAYMHYCSDAERRTDE